MATVDLERVKEQYRRLWLAEEDFQEVISIAQLILDRDFHSRPRETMDVEHRALSLAAVVSYGRAFVESRSPRETPASPFISSKILKSLAPDELELHQLLLQKRNEELAHSDANPVELEFFFTDEGEENSLSVVTRVPLSRSEISKLLVMARTLIDAIRTKRDQLRALLPPDSAF